MFISVLYNTEMNKLLSNPTEEVYAELQEAYDFFNEALFLEKLPPCLITLQRQTNTHGYFSLHRFQHTEEKDVLADEIAMNPDHFKTQPLPEVLSTLVHEMVHLEQAYFGTPSRKSYHNKQWANMMEAVGLMPSSTGEPGGERVGQHMTHYILPGGKFDQACTTLLKKGFRLSWADKFGGEKMKKPVGRVKYTCKICTINAWAKQNIVLICGECKIALTPEVADEPA